MQVLHARASGDRTERAAAVRALRRQMVHWADYDRQANMEERGMSEVEEDLKARLKLRAARAFGPGVPIEQEALDRIIELEAENRRLREALEGLLDVQNDAPLGIREEEWKQAVERARAALSQEENPCD